MSRFYLLNTVALYSNGIYRFFAGDLIDDARTALTPIRDAGGVLIPEDDATVAAAAVGVSKTRKRGYNEEANGIAMLSAAVMSIRDKIAGSASAILLSPTVRGTVVNDSAANGRVLSTTTGVVTSAATTVTIATYTIPNLKVCAFDAIVTHSGGAPAASKGGRWKRSVVYRRSGAGPVIIGAPESGTDQETTAGDDVAFSLSGNDLLVRVTAADTDPRNWVCELRVQENGQ